MADAADVFTRAQQLYDRATFFDDREAARTAARILDGAEAELALARARIWHARFLADGQKQPQELELAERAAALFGQLGDPRGEAEALFWAGVFHQVVRQDGAAARPLLERARDLATTAGDKLTLSYAVRHLGFADMEDGDLAAARPLLEQSAQLRREIDFQPGLAAALLALAELTAEQGDRGQAHTLLDEATAIATQAEATSVLRWIAQTRQDL